MSTENRAAHMATAGLAILSLSVPGVTLAEADLARPVVVSSLTTLIKLSGATALVCVVFWIAARVMKQLQGVSVRSPGRLRIMESLSVGQRERILIIQAGSEQLVIGVTSHQISRLHTFAEPLEAADPAVQQEQTHDFRKKLQNALKKHASA